jgi:hypothetical protein
MTLSITELAMAREATIELLDEIGLDAYLFEVEPRNTHWELKIDCAMATNGSWESIKLLIPKEELLMSHDDAAVHQRILSELRGHFIECKARMR